MILTITNEYSMALTFTRPREWYSGTLFSYTVTRWSHG